MSGKEKSFYLSLATISFIVFLGMPECEQISDCKMLHGEDWSKRIIYLVDGCVGRGHLFLECFLG